MTDDEKKAHREAKALRGGKGDKGGGGRSRGGGRGNGVYSRVLAVLPALVPAP